MASYTLNETELEYYASWYIPTVAKIESPDVNTSTHFINGMKQLLQKQKGKCPITGESFVFIPLNPLSPYLCDNREKPWLPPFELICFILRPLGVKQQCVFHYVPDAPKVIRQPKLYSDDESEESDTDEIDIDTDSLED